MSIRLRPIATALLLAVVTAIFYAPSLSRQPVGPDEARIISAAQHLPDAPSLLIHTGDRWLQPLHVYATSIAHAIAPGFFAGRWASLAIAAINAGLIVMVGWRLFGGYLPAIAAALVLVFMPAHMTFGRQGVEAISIVPFVLLWLYALLGFLATDRPAKIALASGALGAGVYSTPAAPLTMAFLWLTLIVVLWSVGRRKLSTFVVAFGAFAAMLIPLLIWFVLNPQTYLDTYGSWAMHPAHIRNPYDLLLANINRNTLGIRASAYWGMLDPSFLFFASADGRAPIHWTMAPFIVLGLYRASTKRSPASILVLAATAVTPLAGAGFGQPHYIAHALALLPCLALIAGYGVEFVREQITVPAPRPIGEAG